MTGMLRRLLIVEDEPLMRGLLEAEMSASGFAVMTAASAAEAKRVVGRFDPDIALIDITLKGSVSGLHFGHYLAVQHPDIAQVFLTAFQDVEQATRDGLDVPDGAGFVSKHHIKSADDVLDVITNVIRGRQEASTRASAVAAHLNELGPKARRVLDLVAEGFSNRHIAQRLEISEKTVEYYIDQGYRALGLEKSPERNQRVDAALRLQQLKFTETVEEPPG